MTKIKKSGIPIRIYKEGWDFHGYHQIGGNFVDAYITPDSYPPQCRGCKQQHESTHWREDVDKILCDDCYAKEKEHGEEES